MLSCRISKQSKDCTNAEHCADCPKRSPVKMQIPYLIASLCLVLANGQVYDNVKSEISSSTPVNNKEYILYLTLDQVQALQSKGAVVKSTTQLENSFSRQENQANIEKNAELKDQLFLSNENGKQESDQDIFRSLNFQQPQEALAIQSQFTENSKYQYDSNQWEPVIPNNRYSPTTNDRLKLSPYDVRPLTGYSYKDAVVSVNIDAQPNLSPIEFPKFKEIPELIPTQPVDEQKLAENQRCVNILVPKVRRHFQGFFATQQLAQDQDQRPFIIQGQSMGPNSQSSKYAIVTRCFSNTTITSNVQSDTDKTGPVSFDEKAQLNSGASQIQTPSIGGQQDKVLGIPPFLLSSPSALSQTQYSTLLAPQTKDVNIDDSRAEHNGLINNERAIQSQLQQIKESGSHNAEQYKDILNKLRQNLEQQNVLAKQLVSQNEDNKSQYLGREELNLKTPQLIKQQTYPISWDSPTAKKVLLLQKQAVSLNTEPTIRFPETRNAFGNRKKPYIVQRFEQFNNRQDIPFSYISDQS